MNAAERALQKTFRDLAESDCEDIRAFERLIDERRAAPWHNKVLPRPWHWQFADVWRGQTSERRALDVYCSDCGLGDLVMLAGAIRLASLRVGKVRLHCHPRMAWLAPRLFGDRVECVLQSSMTPPAPGWHCSPLDLPGALGAGATVIGNLNAVHCRRVDSEVVAYGLDCSLHYHDLQKAPRDYAQRRAACDELGSELQDIGAPLYGEDRDAFLLTLNVLKRVRGFIGVDSAAAHVAASAGVPTIIMLHERPNWRWGSYVGKQGDCPVPPWYGSHVRAVSWAGTWRLTARAAYAALERLRPREVRDVAAIA